MHTQSKVLTLIFVIGICVSIQSVCVSDGDWICSHSDPISFSTVPGVPTRTNLADFNSDGFDDIVFARSSVMSIVFSNGDGTFSGITSYVLPSTISSMTVADVNGDGSEDVLATVSGFTLDELAVLINNGDGSFADEVTYVVGSPDGESTPRCVVTCDFDGDNNLDVAVANESSPEFGDVSVLRNLGDGTFAPQVRFQTAQSPRCLVPLDIDSDGDLDLAVSMFGNNSSVRRLLNNGIGGFFVQDFPYNVGGASTTAMRAGDINGDSATDVVVSYFNSSALSMLVNDGTSTFDPSLLFFDLGSSPADFIMTDLNGDSSPDLLVALSQVDEIVSFTNDGKGNFSEGTTFSTEDRPSSVAVGDLNGDGMQDIVTTNAGGVSLSIFLSQCFLIGDVNDDGCVNLLDVAPFTTLLANGDFQIEADINQDGSVDLLDVAAFIELLQS